MKKRLSRCVPLPMTAVFGLRRDKSDKWIITDDKETRRNAVCSR